MIVIKYIFLILVTLIIVAISLHYLFGLELFIGRMAGNDLIVLQLPNVGEISYISNSQYNISNWRISSDTSNMRFGKL